MDREAGVCRSISLSVCLSIYLWVYVCIAAAMVYFGGEIISVYQTDMFSPPFSFSMFFPFYFFRDIRMCVCVCVFKYDVQHTYIRTYVYTYAHTDANTDAHTDAHTCTHMRARAHTHTTHTHTHTHTGVRAAVFNFGGKCLLGAVPTARVYLPCPLSGLLCLYTGSLLPIY
jgi:hypothetical protein